MSRRRVHVPAPGKASGLQGVALCGRWSHYATGDHALLRRLLLRAIGDGTASHYCEGCRRKAQ